MSVLSVWARKMYVLWPSAVSLLSLRMFHSLWTMPQEIISKRPKTKKASMVYLAGCLSVVELLGVCLKNVHSNLARPQL